MITCTQFDDLLQDSLLGEIAGPQREEFEAHLGACPACVAILKNAVRTKEMSKAAYEHPSDALPGLSDSHVREIVTAMRRGVANAGPSSASRAG